MSTISSKQVKKPKTQVRARVPSSGVPPPVNQQASARVPQAISFKPTDVAISQSLERLFPDQVELFRKLQNKEKQLDLIINRKLLDLQDHQNDINNKLNEDSRKNEILRIFIYNISENQPWQQAVGQPSLQPPSWTLRVEGRLLSDQALDVPNRKKFSSFLSSVSIQLFKDGKKNTETVIVPNQPNPDIVEWHDDQQRPKSEAEREQTQFDGLDVKRPGSSIPASALHGIEPTAEEKEITCEILIQPKSFPVKLAVKNESLIELLGCSEITQHDCVIKLFNYIKVNNLFEVAEYPQQDGHSIQQAPENIVIKSDDFLFRIFELNSFTVSRMMDAISTKLLKPVDPIRINYTINTLTNSTLGDVVIDLKVNPDLINGPSTSSNNDVSKLISELLDNQSSAADIAKLNDGLTLNLQLLNFNKLKYDFYKGIIENPVEFLEKLHKKNSEYLNILASDSVGFGQTDLVDEEIVRRSDYYTDELISEHIGMLLGSGRM
ncbi:unnamed protein product [Kuraishia capsulata CBS 1993]|uniref:DM2 domain-containing protein n=1 Tax=Kuraishia capsulata CBS 1993 TaxID=1382522 RepID=W6MRV0_9ASCO|nr:uncharacterized protein KUCA_T00005085001 [Kuraishia capsulata CBS 1993]CDK29098.1 unnamed protein product [Kuraishia capsulata CBS 1993]